jgi:hypothetical protein
MTTCAKKAAAAASVGAVAWLISASAIHAHHALGPLFDTDKAVTISGTIVRFERVNPHSYMYVEQETPEGRILWVVEAPAPRLLDLRTAGQNLLSPGSTVEACGYLLKDSSPGPASNRGRVLVAEVVETADGEARMWSDYGNKHCRDQGRYEIPAWL